MSRSRGSDAEDGGLHPGEMGGSPLDGTKRSGACRAGARVLWCVSGCDSGAPRKATPTQATGTRSGHTSGGGEATQNRNKERTAGGPYQASAARLSPNQTQHPPCRGNRNRPPRCTRAAHATRRVGVSPTPPPTRRPPPPSRPTPVSTRARRSTSTHRHATPPHHLVPKQWTPRVGAFQRPRPRPHPPPRPAPPSAPACPRRSDAVSATAAKQEHKSRPPARQVPGGRPSSTDWPTSLPYHGSTASGASHQSSTVR